MYAEIGKAADKSQPRDGAFGGVDALVDQLFKFAFGDPVVAVARA